MSVRTVCSNYDSVKIWQEPLYKDLHQHPELSMQEERTLGIIKGKLADLGFEQVDVSGGVVGILENGAGPTVMLRADFDGLPVKEDTGLIMPPPIPPLTRMETPYPSCTPAVTIRTWPACWAWVRSWRRPPTSGPAPCN